jgi:hypothetical protein
MMILFVLMQCLQLVRKACRCGQKQKEVLCSKQYLCEIKCPRMRDCNKHQCKRKVGIGNTQVSGQWLDYEIQKMMDLKCIKNYLQ